MHVFLSVGLALAALLLIRLHYAGGAALSSDSASDGHRLAEAWCKDCHAIDATTAGTVGAASAAPAFAAIAAFVLFHERLLRVQVAGVVMIAVGVGALSYFQA